MGEFNFAGLVRYLRGLPCGTSGRRKLYSVFCHSCQIYGVLRSKECGGYLKKPSFRVAMQATKGRGGGGSH